MTSVGTPSKGGFGNPSKKAPLGPLICVFTTVSVYSLCYMAQVPLLPYLLKELGANSLSYGTLQTTFSLLQLVGGLLSGPVIDRWGGRSLLLLSLMSSVVSYTLTASATSMVWLYLSRVPTVMQHAILAARTLIAANSPPEDRSRLMGLLGVAYGVGFALGPALGGLMSQVSLRATAWVAAAVSLVNTAAVLALVPVLGSGEQAKKDEAAAAAKADASKAAQNKGWLQALQVLQYPAVRQLIAIKVVSGLAGALLQSVFSLMLQKYYGLESKHNGMVLSYVGVLTMLCQAGGVEPMRRWFGEARAVHLSCVLLALSYLGIAASQHSLIGLLVSFAPCCLGGSVLSTINTAQLTQAAPADVTGSVLALDMSIFAAVRLFTPAAGTALLERSGVAGVGLSAAALFGVLLVAIQLKYVSCDGGIDKSEVADSSKHKAE